MYYFAFLRGEEAETEKLASGRDVRVLAALALARAGDATRAQSATEALARSKRFADDMVILIDSHPRNDWLMRAVDKRLREELAKLRVEINEDKSRTIDLTKGGSFAFRRIRF